jgi:hypothetical protein
MPPSQSGKMAAPRKKRSFGKPIANAEVKTGGKAELISHNARATSEGVSLKPLPFEIDGADFFGRAIPPSFKITDEYIHRVLQDAAAIAPTATREAICERVYRRFATKVAKDRITKIWDAKFGIAWAL